MTYDVSIPFDAIEEKPLSELVGNLAKVSGHEVAMKHEFVLSTESIDLSIMLGNLRDAILQGSAPSAHKANGAKRGPKAKQKMGPRSLRIEKTGEIVSSRELNKLMAAGEVKSNTTVVNAKGVRFVVLADDKGALTLIKEPK